MNKRGFTLVELLAVISILAILAIITLPNIINLFNEAKKMSFLTETKKIFDVAHEQWVSDSMFDTQEMVYARCQSGSCQNQLKLSGRNELNYYIKVDKNGNVIEYYTEDGSYQYSYKGTGLKIEDIDFALQIAQASESDIITITCDGVSNGNANSTVIIPVEPYITIINRQNPGSITVNDEVTIGSEHFYVISTDQNETVLLSKYNLYVGAKVTETCTSSDCATRSLSYTEIRSDDNKYGLQSNLSNAYNYISYPANHSSMTGKSSTSYGFVAFSGTNYWDNSVCEYRTSYSSGSHPYKCSGTKGLNGDYSNSSNQEGKTGYVSVYPYVYRSSMSTMKPINYSYNSCLGNPYASGCGYTNYIGNNGYTISYFVEEYIERLKSLGASSNIEGRLLTYEEASSLSSTIKGSQSYWCGSAYNDSSIYSVNRGNGIYGSFFVQPNYGVKPVIVVPTNEIVL